ncbi:hypothetical protein KSC_006380 [Ktedonobacter sp. SOSP1-52]|nr:hypothetical protein KSC_006380 [Ktedonobacter sp. SOSP1-52]
MLQQMIHKVLDKRVVIDFLIITQTQYPALRTDGTHFIKQRIHNPHKEGFILYLTLF